MVDAEFFPFLTKRQPIALLFYEKQGRVFADVYLRLVPGTKQGGGTLTQLPADFGREFQRPAIDRRAERVDGLIQRIQQNKAPTAEQAGQQTAKGLRPGGARAVGLAEILQQLVARRAWRQRGLQAIKKCAYRGRELHMTHGALWRRSHPFRPQRHQLLIFPQDFGFGNFLQVVVLAGQPEDRDGWNPLLRESLRQTNCGQRFVERIGRTRKSPYLLTGDHRERAGAPQAVDVDKGGGPASKGLVLPLQNIGDLVASVRQLLDFLGKLRVTGRVKRRPIVERRHALVVIKVIEQETRSIGECGNMECWRDSSSVKDPQRS